MNDADLIATINSIIAPIVIVFVLLEFLLLGGRTLLRILTRGASTVPLFQWRDLLLFTSLTVLIVGAQVGRLLGIRLGDLLWWVILTDVLSLSTAIVWLVTEIGVPGRFICALFRHKYPDDDTTGHMLLPACVRCGR